MALQFLSISMMAFAGLTLVMERFDVESMNYYLAVTLATAHTVALCCMIVLSVWTLIIMIKLWLI